MRSMNLNPIKKFVEAQMIDTIRVTRPEQTTESSTWNETLGKYERNSLESGEIYLGLGTVVPKGWIPRDQEVGGQVTTASAYSVSTPLGTPEFLEDDLVEVVACVRDVEMNGKMLIVKAQVWTTYAVSHKVHAELWDGKRPR